MLLAKILENVTYINIEGRQDIYIEDMYYDSRKVTPDSVFFCIEGFNSDGHDFAHDAVKKGAKALVLERDIEGLDNVTKIFVEDSRRAMSYMAANYYNRPAENIKIIGITGTNGKTSIAYLLKSILEIAGLKVGLIGTITNMIGDEILKEDTSTPTTPESLDLQRILAQMIKKGAGAVIVEVTSHSLALGRVEGIVFDIGIFTNLSQDHLDFHKTFENYRDAKGELFANSSMSIINVDDENGDFMIDRAADKVLKYGISNNKSQVFARDIEITQRGLSFQLNILGQSLEADIKIPGIFSVYNSLAAASAAYTLGIEHAFIKKGLESVYEIAGRFEQLDTDTDYSVIIDYAHTPDGLRNILETAKKMSPKRLVVLFGCGGDRDREKRPIMGKVAGKLADFCIVTSDNPRKEDPMAIIDDILPGIVETNCPHIVIENRKEAIIYGLSNAKAGDIIILAGKGHETYQILKDETIEFDEREIVMEFLREGRE
ncbi:MAG: UDP-N-acetylmuramoyl-L-alanyl-D-glutamate--2,6-diaminopimelate ligase [Clostridiales bacterium]|nr:UDP-N-acetylmuramoyl-L-alanyl-D-glutamate--2,6-diaminopimelate ligase [Clostridiales bacterium]